MGPCWRHEAPLRIPPALRPLRRSLWVTWPWPYLGRTAGAPEPLSRRRDPRAGSGPRRRRAGARSWTAGSGRSWRRWGTGSGARGRRCTCGACSAPATARVCRRWRPGSGCADTRCRARGAPAARLAELTARRAHAVGGDLPEGRTVVSFPRAGRVGAARISAALGGGRARFASEDRLAAAAGVCPVTNASGKVRSGRRASHRRALPARPQQAPARRGHRWTAAPSNRRQLPPRLRLGRQRPCPGQRARMQAPPLRLRVLARSDGAAVRRARVLGRAWRTDRTCGPAKHAAAVVTHQAAASRRGASHAHSSFRR